MTSLNKKKIPTVYTTGDIKGKGILIVNTTDTVVSNNGYTTQQINTVTKHKVIFK